MLNLTPSVMSGEICHEKVAACCRCVLQRCVQQEFLDATLCDLKESLQNSKIDAFLIRKIQPARAVSSPRLLFIDLMRAELQFRAGFYEPKTVWFR